MFFMFSLLTKAPPRSFPTNYPQLEDSIPSLVAERILDHCYRNRVLYFLVKWEGLHPEKATWEHYSVLQDHVALIKTYLGTRGLFLEGDSVRIIWSWTSIYVPILVLKWRYGFQIPFIHFLNGLKCCSDIYTPDSQQFSRCQTAGRSGSNTFWVLVHLILVNFQALFITN